LHSKFTNCKIETKNQNVSEQDNHTLNSLKYSKFHLLTCLALYHNTSKTNEGKLLWLLCIISLREKKVCIYNVTVNISVFQLFRQGANTGNIH